MLVMKEEKMERKIFCLLCILLMILDGHSVLALFVVTAPRSSYTAQYGDTVQLICSFPPEENVYISKKLKVSWEHIDSFQGKSQDVLMLTDGKLVLEKQSDTFRGRTTLLMEELNNGRAVLEITNVKLTDSGKYRCVLQLDGSDYKTISLKVKASYKIIDIYRSENEDLLTCQSLGFPIAEVSWQNNGDNVSLPSNFSQFLRPDGVYNITSTIRISRDVTQNYTCVFWNKELNEKTQASFHLEPYQGNFWYRFCLIENIIIILIIGLQSSNHSLALDKTKVIRPLLPSGASQAELAHIGVGVYQVARQLQ
uniref:Programmed cell death 1 ligand 2 n=1 Tax=Xenopus tropicalis TaxID=8364 RepID=A0A6I8Q7L0_XENTR